MEHRSIKEKKVWRGKNGHVRLIWLLLIGIAVYLLWKRAVEAAEELTLESLSASAPLFRTCAGTLIALLGGVGTVVIFGVLKRRLHGEEEGEAFSLRALLPWFCVGLTGALAGTAVCLLTDSLRLALPLNEPRFSLSAALALPLCFTATLAGEVFMMDYIYESARLHLKPLLSVLLVICIEFLEQGAWRLNAVGMLNVALKAQVCCMMHVTLGLAATTGLWFGWSFALSALIGLSGCVWTVYHVSEPWLTGGNRGLFCGLAATAFMLGVILYLYLKFFRNNARKGAVHAEEKR